MFDCDELIYDESGNETSGEDVDFAIELNNTCSKEVQLYDEYRYEVLSTDKIVKHMVECIKDVNAVVSIPSTTTRILLNYFNWDKEKLMEKLFEGNQDELFQDAQVINPFKKVNTVKPKALGRGECKICFMDYAAAQMTGLECGHLFCFQCWDEYLTTKIMEEGVGQSIACPAHNCPILVDDETATGLLRDPKVIQKFQHLITNTFVKCNRLLRWCPGPGCSFAVKVIYVDTKPVTCQCGHRFCFNCGENWHDPVTCAVLKKWRKKCDDYSETFHWLAENTKECPKCKATIIKEGGCSYVTCKNQNCNASFCWVCLGPWQLHIKDGSWLECNRYNEDEAKAARNAHNQSITALQLFYCNRYMNYMQSLPFEHKLYAAVKDKMKEMQQHDMSRIEVQFLKRAVDILCLCRETLKYTYVFAYFLQETNQSVIFEENQKDLERATKVLSEYLERNISKENLVDFKQKVQDKYRYCESRQMALLRHVHEGYEKDWWVYSE